MMQNMWQKLNIVLLSVLFLGLVGCASQQKIDETTGEPIKNTDPFEGYNRAMFKFNDAFITVVMDPVTKTYRFIIPSPARKGVGNFFHNIFEIPNVFNDLLQADLDRAWKDTARFILNSSFGVFGLFDVAETVGLTRHRQSFGLTLAKWGYTDSSYFVMPFIGPSTIRGVIGFAVDLVTYPIFYINEPALSYGLAATNYVQEASVSVPGYKSLTKFALDPYVAVRNAYLQNRKYVIEKLRDGQDVDASETQSLSGGL